MKYNSEEIVINFLWDMYSFIENPKELDNLLIRLKKNEATDYDIYVINLLKQRIKAYHNKDFNVFLKELTKQHHYKQQHHTKQHHHTKHHKRH